MSVATIPGASTAVAAGSDMSKHAEVALRQKARVVALVSASLMAFGMLWMTLAN